MEKFPLRFFNTEITKIFENPQIRLTHLDITSLDFGSLKNVLWNFYIMSLR